MSETEQPVKQFPFRIVRPGLEVVYVGVADGDPAGLGWQGVTDRVWTRRIVQAIASHGMTLWPDPGKTFSPSYDWEQLQFWRLYVVRRGRSHIRRWEMVERHYLYKINVEATQRAWAQAKRIAKWDDPHFDFQWEVKK